MEALVALLRNFFCGAACVGATALFIMIMKNKAAFKKEEKLTADEIFKWEMIAILLGGCIGGALLY
jgi:hypothetical protein